MAKQTQTVVIKKPRGGGSGGRSIKVASNTRKRGQGATRRKKKA